MACIIRFTIYLKLMSSFIVVTSATMELRTRYLTS